jgi:hypothetical protein
MPMWRCPHCGTPQAETARCWVCHRSSTACGTCRHYRRSVAGQLGYCGLDRTRQPLTGDEIRSCWESWPGGAALPDATPTIGAAGPIIDQHRHVDFIEVGATAGVRSAAEARSTAEEPDLAPPQPREEPGWSLWGDPEG